MTDNSKMHEVESTEPRVINPLPDNNDEFAEHRPLIRALARKVVKYGLETPAIMMLEAHKPLHWILSQGLSFANPSISIASELFAIATKEDLDRLARFLEDRKAFDVLIKEIEEQESHKKRLIETEADKT